MDVNEPDDIDADPPAAVIDLRVLATSDLHMHILPYDYVADRASMSVGLACTAGLIHQARAEASNTLLFDIGDCLQGAPMGDEIARAILADEDGLADEVHPMVAAMMALDYDAMSLGNHDFDYGLDFLSSALAGVALPVIASNLSVYPQPGRRLPALRPATVPFALLQRQFADRDGKIHPICVGLIGLVPPRSIAGVQFAPYRADLRDIVPVARSAVPQLRALGADVVIALAHSGIGATEDRPGLENAAVPLAEVEGIDAIVAGHAHQVFPGGPVPESPAIDPLNGRIHGLPVVSPGFWGSHLGVIDLVLERRESGKGGWRVVEASVEARAIRTALEAADENGDCSFGPDPAILRLMQRMHEFTIDRVRRPLGRTSRLIHSYFACAAPSPANDFVLRAKSAWVERRLAGTDLAGLPVVASTPPFRAGGYAGPGHYTRIEPGPITIRSLAGLYPYPNDLAVMQVSGAELVEWLERAASVFNRLTPGLAAQPLIAPSTPAYAFDALGGVDYSIDLAAPARYTPAGRLADPTARRVRDIRLDGRPLEDGDSLLLVTNSYRMSGGGRYPGARPDRALPGLRAAVRDVLTEYAVAVSPYDEPPLQNWRFAPLPGVSALFSSAPEAEELLGELPFRCSAGGLDEHGFRLYEIAL